MSSIIRITNPQDLTPVQRLGYYYFKRDDMFIPFDFSPANGSKMRQCILLCEKNLSACKNGIVTGTSIHSPQAVITATYAKAINTKCKIFYGGTSIQRLNANKYSAICQKLEAELVVEKSGYNSVLTKYADDFAASINGFNIRYGFDLMNNIGVFVNSVANQTSNIPDGIDYLVITVGSAITLLGVLLGISKYKKHIGCIVGVGCAPNREQKIRDYAKIISAQTGYDMQLDRLRYFDCFNKLKGYKYEYTQRASYLGLTFHPRYEAKTFNFMRKYIPHDATTVMWITGHDM